MSAPTAVDARLPHAGEVWADKYRIVGLIGRGAMGHVLAAEHLLSGQCVALKFITDESTGRRFIREARTAQALTSEHVVRVFDVGIERSVPYLVMELLEGTDLAAWLRRSGKLPVPEAVDYVLQACVGVAAAHARGIVHRDLKPSNLFRTLRANGQPLVKVLDFGISKELERVEREQTAPRALLGSPHYMSPEQLRNPRLVDARTDVWSLAVTLHTLLTGQPPFEGETIAELSIAIATDPPKRLGAVVTGVHEGLEDVLAQALEKRPEARIPSVVELGRRLGAFASPAGRLVAEQLAAQFAAPPEISEANLDDRAHDDSASGSVGPLTVTDADDRRTPAGLPEKADPYRNRAPPATFVRSGRAALLGSLGLASVVVTWRLLSEDLPPAVPSATRESNSRVVASNESPSLTRLPERFETNLPQPSSSTPTEFLPRREPSSTPSKPSTGRTRISARTPSPVPKSVAASAEKPAPVPPSRSVDIDGFPIVQ